MSQEKSVRQRFCVVCIVCLSSLLGSELFLSSGVAEPIDKSREAAAVPLSFVQTETVHEGTASQKAARPIIRHVRFSGGLPFLAAHPAQDPIARLLELINREGGKSFESYLEATNRELEKSEHPKLLPRCAGARKEKLDLELSEEFSHEVIIEDILFLGEDPPLDSESRYGESATIYVLDKKTSPALRGFSDAIGVSCVPYRVRTTTQAIYRFEGEDAIKRYEEISDEHRSIEQQ